jgi:hypothetical protein
VKLTNRPNLADDWVYVWTDDEDFDTGDSPQWLNGFTFEAGAPVAFRHGLDGQTDMIGVYDLTGAVSGDTAFMMPLRWAEEMPLAAQFPIELETDVWSLAIQVCDVALVTLGEVPIKIFWPIVATAYP